MKKFVSILVSLALVFSFASIGLFAEPNNTTSVTYNITPTYTVIIPQSIAIGENLVITANNMNLEPGKWVVVRVSNGITDHSSIMLVRQNASGNPETPNGSNVLETQVALNTSPVDNTTHFAEFCNNSTDNQITHYLEFGNPDTNGKLAGTYKGTLTFSISYEQRIIYG